jgi:hypothetical protein
VVGWEPAVECVTTGYGAVSVNSARLAGGLMRFMRGSKPRELLVVFAAWCRTVDMDMDMDSG